MALQRKFTLLEILDSGTLNGYLPNLSNNNKYKTRVSSKGRTLLKNGVAIDTIERQIVNGVIVAHSGVRGTSGKGTVKIYYKASDYNSGVDKYNDIVATIKAMKSSLKYVNTFTKEIKSAYKYSITQALNGREIPRLALKINSIEEIKGMTPIKKRNLVYAIIENILFDDEFSNSQGWTKSDRGRYGVPKTQNAKYRYWKTLKRDYDERTKNV